MKISELIPDDKNANKGTERGLGLLKQSLRDYGAGRSLVCDRNGRLISGNKTAEAMGSIGLEDLIVVESDGTKGVVVKRTDIDLDTARGRALAIADNRVGEINLDWDEDELRNIQTEYNLDLSQFSFEDLPGIVEESAIDENPYSQEIKSPIYEPTGAKPHLSALCSTEKTSELESKIETAPIPDDIKDFLRLAAQRHLVFNYENIAEYYAHAPVEVQRLMEESALVIIDFDKAIEGGFVRLSKHLAEAFNEGI